MDHRCGVRGRSAELEQKNAGQRTSKSHVKEDDWVLVRSLGHGCGSADADLVQSTVVMSCAGSDDAVSVRLWRVRVL